MRLFALISFYDESPDMLKQSVRHALKVGCTDILALDGAYAHYPHLEPVSDPACYQAIRDAAGTTPCTIEQITGATEAGKRTRLFEMAYEHDATPDDYLFVQDADHAIVNPQDIKPLLTEDVYCTLGIEGDSARYNALTGRRYPRLVYRAVPGLHVHPRVHWWYIDGEGRTLWGYNAIPGGRLPLIVLNHSEQRTKRRVRDRNTYYTQRVRQQVEEYLLPASCIDCHNMHTGQAIPTDFFVIVAPDNAVSVGHERTVFCCETHAIDYQKRNSRDYEKALKRFAYRHPDLFSRADVRESIKQQFNRYAGSGRASGKIAA